MTLLSGFFIFLLIWWVMLFTVLPLGVERHADQGQGHDPGAPKVPDLKRKLILNTVLSLIILAVFWVLVEMDVIQWRNWFDGGGVL